MEHSFDNESMSTTGLGITKITSKRKRQPTDCNELCKTVKKQKLINGSGLNTPPLSITSEPSPGSFAGAQITWSTSTSKSVTPHSTTQPKKNKGGRPRKDVQYPCTKILKAPTRMRKEREFKTPLPFEIWQSILAFSPLEFLLKIQKQVDYFDEILARNDSTWKLARRRQFDPNMPDAPPGLSETRYAILLTRTGCDVCKEGKARKVYWAYQMKLCELCHAKVIVSEAKLKNEYEHDLRGFYEPFFYQMLQCVPAAKYDSWGHYQWVGDYDEPPPWGRLYPNGQKRQYLRTNFEDLKAAITKAGLHSESTAEEVEGFFKPRIAANEAYVKYLQAVEGWEMTYKLKEQREKASNKAARAKFYKEQALLMSPPLEIEALELCPSYIKAANIPRPPTAKTWEILLEKLKIERTGVEKELEKQRWHESVMEYRDYLKQDYEENLANRAEDSTPEQIFVLSIADQVVNGLRSLSLGLADEDLLHVFFQRVYDKFEASKRKPQGKHGEYRLLMDDARMVYQKMYLPFLEEQENLARSIMKATHMQHIHHDHKFDETFRHLTAGSVTYSLDHFPWLHVEWPRNLPVLALHHTVTGKWDPEAKSEYQFGDF